MDNYCILRVIKAEYLSGYRLQLTFNNGESRVVDFVPLMQKGVCRKLQDMEYFRSFTLDPFTVDWNNEIGFAPEFLYEHGIKPYEYNDDAPLVAAEADLHE